jgi:hypothetical protein
LFPRRRCEASRVTKNIRPAGSPVWLAYRSSCQYGIVADFSIRSSCVLVSFLFLPACFLDPKRPGVCRNKAANSAREQPSATRSTRKPMPKERGVRCVIMTIPAYRLFCRRTASRSARQQVVDEPQGIRGPPVCAGPSLSTSRQCPIQLPTGLLNGYITASFVRVALVALFAVMIKVCAISVRSRRCRTHPCSRVRPSSNNVRSEPGPLPRNSSRLYRHSHPKAARHPRPGSAKVPHKECDPIDQPTAHRVRPHHFVHAFIYIIVCSLDAVNVEPRRD